MRFILAILAFAALVLVGCGTAPEIGVLTLVPAGSVITAPPGEVIRTGHPNRQPTEARQVKIPDPLMILRTDLPPAPDPDPNANLIPA
jgi:hypothetical protein